MGFGGVVMERGRNVSVCCVGKGKNRKENGTQNPESRYFFCADEGEGGAANLSGRVFPLHDQIQGNIAQPIREMPMEYPSALHGVLTTMPLKLKF